MEPRWNKETREWVLEIPMNDENIGDYIQVVRTETLYSLQKYINETKQSKGR